MSGLQDALVSTSATIPYDPRFANHNVVKSCYLYYVKFHNCMSTAEDPNEYCCDLKLKYQRHCALPQTKVWDTIRKQGKFAGINPKYQGKNAFDYEEDEE